MKYTDAKIVEERIQDSGRKVVKIRVYEGEWVTEALQDPVTHEMREETYYKRTKVLRDFHLHINVTDQDSERTIHTFIEEKLEEDQTRTTIDEQKPGTYDNKKSKKKGFFGMVWGNIFKT